MIKREVDGTFKRGVTLRSVAVRAKRRIEAERQAEAERDEAERVREETALVTDLGHPQRH